MSQSQIDLQTPFGILFGFKQEHQTTIQEGQSLIIKIWSWRKFGFIQKSVTLKDGKITVEVLNK
ncbi:MAG: hypothetical protein KGH87_08925 [Thaumarchaeota archaeon]|nr:hypothetical protein [Nitrososphaerota archaeon]MDE1840027.1 hypothetical protein [Nitrososphaerota archaeon]